MRNNPDDLANQDLEDRYTHKELLEYIHQLKTIEENEDE